MAAPVIRLDTSKPHSEVRGERTPDDPHYKVHFMQGRMVGKKMVLLPFDSQGVLVPDDGKTEPYAGFNVESKPVTHMPLYTDDMRALVDRIKKKLSGARTAAELEEVEEEEDHDAEEDANPADEVNFVSWLKGEVKYTPQVLRAAAKQRYHIMFKDEREMVVGLVVDEKVVPEDQVSPLFAKYLKG